MAQIHYIREIMQRKGVSITELESRLGITQQSASSYLVHDIRLSKAKNIADALGVSLPALFVEPEQFTQSAPEESKSATVRCPKCGSELEIVMKPK